MTLKELAYLFRVKFPKETEDMMRRQMPEIAGRMAVSHFRDNFRQSGFVNRGLHPWEPSKRIGKNTSAASNYGTLLSGHDHLYNRIIHIPGDWRVTIQNRVPYAAIHNEGGTIPVTDKMKRYGWYRFYLELGIKGGGKIPKSVPEEAEQWRRLALTKKTKIIIPKRQFIGESEELDLKIALKIEERVYKIFNT